MEYTIDNMVNTTCQKPTRSAQRRLCIPVLAGLFLLESFMKTIPLTQGKFAIVDDEDYPELSKYKWYIARGYAVRGFKGKTIFMHKNILNTPNGFQTDHINHNGLDNKRCNLRICTASQNQQNRQHRPDGSSKYKGVWWDKVRKKWKSQIKHNNCMIYLGYFISEKEAAKMYDIKAIELFGEFAYLNFGDHLVG